jgi:pimeloyl-ACP methyl ester carboxylesterase
MTGSSVVSFDGTPIWFSDTGDGPTVVLLHGATMTSISNFETRFGVGDDGRAGPVEGPTVASRLRDAGARVVGVDARGHGRSGRSPDPDRYRGDAHAGDVTAVLDALGSEEVDVVGYSMGAMTAARLLGTERRLRSVALCGTGPRHVLDDGVTSASGVDLAAVGRCFRSNDWADHPEYKPYRAFARLDPVHDFESIGAALLGLEGVPADRLSAATVPVLVLNGGRDDPEGSAAALAAMIPGASASVSGSSDHGFACSDDDFHAALVSFLSRGWSR